jgi:hypothetical protein
MTEESEAVIEKKVEQQIEQMLSNEMHPLAQRLKSMMNPAALTPLRPPPPAERGMVGSVPPILSSPRPPLPPPPMPLPARAARGVLPAAEGVERPKTLYAKELEEMAKNMAPPRLCPLCSNTKMVNTKRNARNEIIEYHACPKCMDCKVVEG